MYVQNGTYITLLSTMTIWNTHKIRYKNGIFYSMSLYILKCALCFVISIFLNVHIVLNLKVYCRSYIYVYREMRHRELIWVFKTSQTKNISNCEKLHIFLLNIFIPVCVSFFIWSSQNQFFVFLLFIRLNFYVAVIRS